MKPSTPHVKGTDLVTIKNMLTQKGPDAISAFEQCASPEAKTVFQTILSGTWVPNALATEIMECAAYVLFPHTDQALEKLGRACAEVSLSGIYKAFLSLTTVPFLLKHVPMVWTMYHSVGVAEVIPRDDKKGASLYVTGAPGVKVGNLRLVGGFSARALEMAGAKHVKVQLDTANPDKWQWNFTWGL